MLAFSFGAGRRNPRARRIEADARAEVLGAALAGQPSEVEAWWSPHLWAGGHRSTDRWEGASGVAIDIDYRDVGGSHTAPEAEVAARLMALFREGMPGNIFHATPRGARVIFLFPEIVRDRGEYAAAARAAAADVKASLTRSGLDSYVIDEACLLDLARLLYSPNAIVGGVQREAEIIISPAPIEIPRLRPAALAVVAAGGRAAAVAAYNSAHAREWPHSGGDCPICGHKECFGRLPDAPSRWVCFSSDHRDVGVRGEGCWHGDALDVDAHAAGKSRGEMVRGVPATMAATLRPGSWTKSYASLVDILRHERKIIEGALEYDEMLCSPTIDGMAVSDADIGMLRERIELIIRTKERGGLRFASADIWQAIEQVAAENKYNPVREYLEHLAWDGVVRLDRVPREVLGAAGDALTISMIRKWFISAAARAMRPGCKVDTVLILKGEQGAGKSSFFRTLAGEPWFSDSPIDISNKDALMILRRCWILEWSELDSMHRARDQGSVKAFLSSSIDTFRPPFGRATVDARRHCVIVGSTNDSEILTDPTGNRRYWIVPVGQIDLAAAERARDQLWAEAVTAYRAGERWYLNREEDAEMRKRQSEYERRDPWEEDVLRYADKGAVGGFSTADVLASALQKPAGQWSSADARRVAAILRGIGWISRLTGRDRVRRWVRD